MSSPIINDVVPFQQYVATGGQTTFVYPFAIFEDADVKVYKRAAAASPGDATQLLQFGVDYTVTGAGSDSGGNIVLTTGATTGDIITIIRNMALERRTVFQPGTLTDDALNEEFNNVLAMIQDLNMSLAKIIPGYNYSAIFNLNNKKLPTLPAGYTWRMNSAGTGIEAVPFDDSDPGAGILRAELASHAVSMGASLVGIVGGAGTVQDFYTDTTAKLSGINRINYGEDTGAANALVVTLETPIDDYENGQLFLVKVLATNTDASTINIDGKGVIAIKYLDGSALEPSDLLAGRTAFLSYYAAGDYAILLNPDYVRRGDTGVIVQEVSTSTSNYLSGTATMPMNDSIRVNTEGDEYLALTITPTSTSNKLRIKALVHASSSVAHNMGLAIFQDATVNALAVAYENNQTANTLRQLEIDFEITAAITTATTFKIRVGTDVAGTTMINGTSGARKGGGILFSSLSITERRP